MTVRDPAAKVGEGDEVTLAGQPVRDSALQYFMLHKPAGVLTAARDGRAQTVMDLVPPALLRRRVLPVGTTAFSKARSVNLAIAAPFPASSLVPCSFRA